MEYLQKFEAAVNQDKIVMYNDVTGDLKLTTARIDGRVYQKYLSDGYLPIGSISGWNVVGRPLNAKEKIILTERI